MRYYRAVLPIPHGDVAFEMRQSIKKTVQNRLVCVKIDCAKRMSCSFLGIDIQYALNGKFELRNLSTSELTDRQTGVTLKRMVCDVLKEFTLNFHKFTRLQLTME